MTPASPVYTTHPRVRGALIVAGLVTWFLFGPAAHAVTRSVLEVIRDVPSFVSGFKTETVACGAILSDFDERLRTLLPIENGRAARFGLADHVARLHAAAHLVHARGAEPLLMPEHDRALTLYLADLDTLEVGRLAPFGFELLVIFAKLAAVLPDHPDREPSTYYGLRGVIEKVVNLKNDGTKRTHALVAQALDQLARARVSRLTQVARFDEQIRESFEDLERLQHEDSLGDRDHLRTITGLAVFARVVPAMTLYPTNERANRALELLRRFDPIETAVRTLVTGRGANDVHRNVLVQRRLTTIMMTPQIEGLHDLRARVGRLQTSLVRPPIVHN